MGSVAACYCPCPLQVVVTGRAPMGSLLQDELEGRGRVGVREYGEKGDDAGHQGPF